jgi:hypothetical protein
MFRSRWTFRLTNLPVLALGLAAAGFGVAALTLGNGDAVVERGFKRALASMATEPGTARTTVGKDAEVRAPFWFRHAVHKGGAHRTKPLAVGDSITISSGGQDRVLHVVGVDKLDSSVLPVSSDRTAPLLLVTCRDEANPESRPVRLLIEADDELPAVSLVSIPRTL